MSTPTDLATSLRLAHMDLLGVTDLMARVRQHPRYAELCRIADEGEDPDHPAVHLAAEIEAEDETVTGWYLVTVSKALRAALAWMDGEVTE